MKTHPYLRAYLAGILVPTFILPVMLAGFLTLRLGVGIQVPIERGLIFPMALVPSLWGLWNMFWLGTHTRTHLPLGVHGAVLPLLLVPSGTIAALSLGIMSLGASTVTWFHSIEIPYSLISVGILAALAAYYLVWKYIVGFVNRLLEIA
jgi:hypothetical protein